MLEFYDFLYTHLDYWKFQLAQMDTDAFYIGISEETLDNCVKPEKRDSWERLKEQFIENPNDTESLGKPGKHLYRKIFSLYSM